MDFATPILAAGPGIETESILITLAVAAFGGVALMALARRVGISAIVLLLAGGVLLGPQVLGIVRPDTLGPALSLIVPLAVAIILFEGGLTLDPAGYKSAPGAIKRLLSVGVIITWLGTALAIGLLFGLSPGFALLCGSMVIVTGPTVVSPLLKRIRVKPKLHGILYWEGVLIDPIGVFVALLAFEWMLGKSELEGLIGFGGRVVVGFVVGIALGLFLTLTLRRKWIPDELVDVAALGTALLAYAIAEQVYSECGLLATTVAGFVLTITKPFAYKRIRQFKASITDLLICMLFVILAARLEFEQFKEFGIAGVAIVAIVIFVIRPISILVSTFKLGFKWNEIAFLSWIAPRGIVAGSLASLFALQLSEAGYENARLLETFVFSVIIATVLLQGLSAGFVARKLGLTLPEPTGWVIIGAHRFGRDLASAIRTNADVPVLLIDTNKAAIRAARRDGHKAIEGDARDTELIDRLVEPTSYGRLLALTDNEDLNLLLARQWSERMGREQTFAWFGRSGELSSDDEFTEQLVWRDLLKPSLVSNSIEEGELELIESSELDPTEWHTGQLFLLTKGKATILPAERKPAMTSKPANQKFVYLRLVPKNPPA